ncbi:Putative deoxynucleoside monophosphate kinase, partial [Orpheovirus IHUMI-LCC2]
LVTTGNLNAFGSTLNDENPLSNITVDEDDNGYTSQEILDTNIIIPFMGENLQTDQLQYDGAIKFWNMENAGGKSKYSEAWSIEYLHRQLGLSDVLCELEVQYWVKYKMVDYVGNIGNCRIGVSVTRALGYPDRNIMTYEEAYDLVEKKLNGLIIARRSACYVNNFYTCILHVFCYNKHISNMVRKAFGKVKERMVETDNVLLLTTVNNEIPMYTM